MSRTLLVVALVLAAPSALAQGEAEETLPPEGTRYVYKAVTEMPFEDPLAVGAELVRPQGVLMWDRKRGQFRPLIDLRKDFVAEIDASVDCVR